MSIEYTIFCDNCGRHLDASMKSAAAARLVVRNMGGRVNLPGGKDLCNYCVPDGEARTMPARNDR